MNNFFHGKVNTLEALLLGAFTSVLLQACGAERTTPFNPETSSSSSSVSPVSTSLITQGTTTTSPIDHPGKSLSVMRDDTEFFNVVDQYTNANPDETDFDFVNGQVVLVDMGNVNGCEQHVNFSSLSAKKTGTNGVKVVINYSESGANASGCSTSITRPYYFYYINSRGPLVFEENIP